ncbi:MAG: tetratricopeptide (TPR) repeat protein [Lentisphaeria bacterium]|jgi:tetratricopeptide (TPR) repeat protein
MAWLFSLNRQVPVFAVSILAYIGCLSFSWLTLPSVESTVINAPGVLAMDITNSWIPIVFRLAFATSLPLVLLAWFQGYKTIALKMLWLLLVLSILFPSILTYWDPQTKIDFEFLDSSMAKVVYQMEMQHDIQQSDWRIWQDFSAQSTHAINQVPSVLTWSLSMLLGSSLPAIVSGLLGFSDSFLAFSAKGWVLSIMGSLLGMLGIYLRADPDRLSFRQSLKFFLKAFICLIFISQTPSMVAEYYYSRADYLATIGENGQAIDAYEQVVKFKPIYAYNSAYLIKLGHLYKLKNCQTCLNTYLYEALTSIQNGNLSRAHYWLSRADKEYPRDKNITYRLSGVLNLMAADSFNAHHYSQAAQLWRQSLMLTPTSASSWYGLSISALVLKRMDLSSLYSQQLFTLQQNMGFKSLVIPAQIHLYKSWFLFDQGNYAAAHDVYRTSKLPESW